MRPLRPAIPALALLAALAGCSGTLYDAAGVPLISTGPGLTCVDPATHVCDVAGVASCVPQSPQQCGDSCTACPVPTGASGATCDLVGTTYSCGYACALGQLHCAGGCCSVTAVAAGDAHACAITRAGSLACWGKNDHGQLGPGAPAGGSIHPNEVYASGVTAVAAGARHTCAVVSGAVSCWGDNAAGQLGSGSASAGGATPVPAGVTSATGLALGDAHSCALDGAAGSVTCWGDNAAGQLGNGSTTANPALKAKPFTTGATVLSAAAKNTCAVVSGTSGTTVRCWGANESGQVGAGGFASPRPAPVTVVGLPAFAPLSLAVGHHHACVALGDQPSKAGGLFCWGADDSGQLGRGSADPATGTNSAVAVQAAKFDNTARSILTAAGDGTTCTAKDPLELICGGLNDRLQAGAATAGPALEGLAVSLGGNLVTASSGGDFTCALVDVGVGAPSIGVKCWGGNASGQLGRDTAGAADGSPAYVTP